LDVRLGKKSNFFLLTVAIAIYPPHRSQAQKWGFCIDQNVEGFKTMAKPKTALSAELTAALRACVSCYGREWRSELNEAWLNGRYHHSLKDHISALQSRRNTEDSTAWLRSLKKSSFESSSVEDSLSKQLEANVVIVIDERTIREMMDSKGSTSWVLGREIEDDWIQLSRLSPRSRGDSETIFVCEKSVYYKLSKARHAQPK
jgi:hypothetical protein